MRTNLSKRRPVCFRSIGLAWVAPCPQTHKRPKNICRCLQMGVSETTIGPQFGALNQFIPRITDSNHTRWYTFRALGSCVRR